LKTIALVGNDLREVFIEVVVFAFSLAMVFVKKLKSKDGKF